MVELNRNLQSDFLVPLNITSHFVEFQQRKD